MVFPGKKRILYVDGSLDSCELLSFILDDAGYEIETAQSVVEGCQRAQSGKFELYLIDLTLPDGTGFDLIQKIREFDPVAPIVICSGQAHESMQDGALRVNIQALITKPIDLDKLAKTVTELLNDDSGNFSVL